jgi:hypothetical protein
MKPIALAVLLLAGAAFVVGPSILAFEQAQAANNAGGGPGNSGPGDKNSPGNGKGGVGPGPGPGGPAGAAPD